MKLGSLLEIRDTVVSKRSLNQRIIKVDNIEIVKEADLRVGQEVAVPVRQEDSLSKQPTNTCPSLKTVNVTENSELSINAYVCAYTYTRPL